MPIESLCPGCRTKVRIPEALLGKSVKCPKCKKIFTAEEPDPGFEEVAEDDRPRHRSRPKDDYPDDEYDDPPRRPARRGRSYARSAVQAPAIGLMVSGGIGIAIGVGFFVMLFYTLARVGGQPGVKINWAYLAGQIGGTLLGMTLSGVMIAGALKMKRLESRGSAKTACILGLLPCAGFCLIGLPFGIWGLVVMANPDVDRAFYG